MPRYGLRYGLLIALAAVVASVPLIGMRSFGAPGLVSQITVPSPMAPSPAGSATPAGMFRWPLAGTPAVVRPFDPPAESWLPGHRGVDLAGSPGEQVLAAGAGTVAYAGTVAGVGVVSIAHQDGLRTTYEPVNAGVRPGQPVAAGQAIGTLLAGHPGCPPTVAACLHWGLLRGGAYLDPLLLFDLGQVRLLPLPGDTAS